MATLSNMYDLHAAPIDSFDPLPSGWYQVVITDSQMKVTKAGTGEYLELTHRVIDGPHKGALAWARLNLINSNPKAQEIAQRQFAGIRKATGVLAPTDSVQLHNIPMWARIDFEPADPSNSRSRDGNEFREWRSIQDPPTAVTAASQGAVTQGPPSTGAPAAPAVPTPPPAWSAGVTTGAQNRGVSAGVTAPTTGSGGARRPW